MIAIDFSRQKARYVNSKAIQQIHFIGNLERDGTTTIFFIIKEAKETILEVLQGTIESIVNVFCFNKISI